MCPLPTFTNLTDQELIVEVERLSARERHATGELIAALMEVDRRRLYLREGCSSLFTYCTQVLHLSEHAAYKRIQAARTAGRVPAILDMLVDGSLTLSTIVLLAPHLNADNHQRLLAAAQHKSRREVELLVATIHPQPAMRSAWLRPLTADQYKLQMTLNHTTIEKLRRVQDLLRHTLPTGDPAAIFDRALGLLLADLERKKAGATDTPCTQRSVPPGSRYIPRSVRRFVWSRDGGRCAFVGGSGRCTERGFLEFHHVVPYAAGGETCADNLELRCRAHNAYEADQYFGAKIPLLVREVGRLFSGSRLDSSVIEAQLAGDDFVRTYG